MNLVQRQQAKVIELRPQIKQWNRQYDSLEEFIDDCYTRIDELGEDHGISVELKAQVVQANKELYELELLIEEAHKRIDAITESIEKQLTRVYNNTYKK